MGMTCDRVDFEAKTAFLPETKNGRARKLARRQDLVELLQDLPRGTATVFAVGADYLVWAWAKACAMAGISDLHIHDARHEALSRLAEGATARRLTTVAPMPHAVASETAILLFAREAARRPSSGH